MDLSKSNGGTRGLNPCCPDETASLEQNLPKNLNVETRANFTV
jgi:hypothetical protein